MQPVTSTFNITAQIIELLAPVALFLAALFVVRPRRPKGYILIAFGAALMFAMRLFVPLGNYIIRSSDGLKEYGTLTATVSVAGAGISFLGMLLVIAGIARLAKIKIR